MNEALPFIIGVLLGLIVVIIAIPFIGHAVHWYWNWVERFFERRKSK